MSDYGDGPVRPSIPRRLPIRLVPALLGAVVVLVLFVTAVMWIIVREEVNANEILIKVNKTGKTLPPDLVNDFGDQVILYPELVSAIAEKTGEKEEDIRKGYKGIQLEVLKEGRYFPCPYKYKTIKARTTIIGQDEVGVLIRKFGRPLEERKTVATEPDERGPVEQVLMPGREPVNPLAYDVQKFPVVQIPEGHVGVVTLLSGKEPTVANTYTVEPGERGVQRETLPPGREYANPYVEQIDIVDVRSHKYDMLHDDAIHFPSSDGFTITIEGTIEWAIRPARVAEVTVAYGDEENILDKVILPNARSISRIQGSKLRAKEFISGKTRTAFQDRLLVELKRECWEQGIDIKSALVRDIQPPDEIASLISQREQADQEIERSRNEMEEAKAEARLVEQQELQQRNKAVGDARREVVTLTQKAEQEKVVAVTEAQRALEVAKLDLESAKKQAAAIRSRGQADANVVLFTYQAEAEPLAMAVEAFGDGTTYAQQFFLRRIAPSVRSILSNTEGPFAEIFRQLQTFDAAPAKSGGAQ